MTLDETLRKVRVSHAEGRWQLAVGLLQRLIIPDSGLWQSGLVRGVDLAHSAVFGAFSKCGEAGTLRG